MNEFLIAVAKGDGVGAETTFETTRILNAVGYVSDIKFDFVDMPISGEAYEKSGEQMPDASLQTARDIGAVLKGPVGGPPNSEDPRWKNAEKEAVVGFRKELGLDVGIRPVDMTLSRVLSEVSPIQTELAGDTNLVVVGDLAGDFYTGFSGWYPTFSRGRFIKNFFEINSYNQNQVDRTLDVAIELAIERNDPLTLVDKTNVLRRTGRLWSERFFERTEEFPDLKANYKHIDDAVQAVMGESGDYGVIVARNSYRDIISDATAKLLGSIGCGPALEIGADITVAGPVHGSAPNLPPGAANPMGTILSSALLLEKHYGLSDEARLIRQAVGRVLDKGYMTHDLYLKARKLRRRSFGVIPVDTSIFGGLIVGEIKKSA